MIPRRMLTLAAAAGLLTVAVACGGGGQSATPTPAPTSVPTATPANPAGSTPTPAGSTGGPPPMPGANLPMPPAGADYIQLVVDGGPDDGLYFAFYPDRTPLCYPGMLAPLNVTFNGSAEGTGGSTLHKFTLLSPAPGLAGTSEFLLEVSIAKGNDTRRYELVPANGKGDGLLATADHAEHSVISISGSTADGTALGAGVVCVK